MDEPTIGLDVVAKERIRRFIAHINQEKGTTVLLTTNDISDVEKLCDRVIIIDHGRLIFDGELSNLRDRFGRKRELIVDFAEQYDQLKISNARIMDRKGLRVIYNFNRDVISAAELINNISSKFRIKDLTVREPDIEAIIRRIYEERLLD